jgi:hypothetical protein
LVDSVVSGSAGTATARSIGGEISGGRIAALKALTGRSICSGNEVIGSCGTTAGAT